MNVFLQKVSHDNFPVIFTHEDLYSLGFGKNYVHSNLQSLLQNSIIDEITDGIYTLGRKHRKELVSEGVLSQKLVPDSYVSFELALSAASWIPEAVYIVTCATKGEDETIDAGKYGRYKYRNIRQRNFDAGVKIVPYGNDRYRKATPLKALADIICRDGFEWTTLEPLDKSFRIEDEDLETLTSEDFDELQGSYGIANVENFLCGIRKELAL